jgi:hypothetical protein
VRGLRVSELQTPKSLGGVRTSLIKTVAANPRGISLAHATFAVKQLDLETDWKARIL